MENQTIKRNGNIFPPPFLPYEHQIPIIKKMIDTILKGESGLIIQPTATGKSVEASFVARACILLHKMKGLYLYNENEGLEQARERFELVLGKNEVKSANFFGYGKDNSVTEADMVFASFQSLNNHTEKLYQMFNKEHFDFIIVNEAHHGQAFTYREVIDHFTCSKIGMTATPEREDGKNILDIFDKVLHEITLEEAIAKNMIAGIEYHICSHGISAQKLKEICREVIEEGKRISIKQLNESIFIDLLDEVIIDEIIKYAFPENDDSHQTLIFCETILHAERFYELLMKRGLKAERIHSKIGTKHNRDVMKRFRANEFQFLVSIDKLNEDIDVPEAVLGVFLRSTSSKRIFIQQLGRLLRRTMSKKKAIFLDFVTNAERLIFLADLMKKITEIAETIENKHPIMKTPIYVSGAGFDFTLTNDLVQVLDLIRALKEGYLKTWQEASAIVMSANIRSEEEYKKRYKSLSLQLHSHPRELYSDFPGWKIFLGTKYQTWQEASTACIKLEVKNSKDYKRVQNFRGGSRDNKLPIDPEDFYSDFPGWKTFLGFKSVPKGWVDLEEFFAKKRSAEYTWTLMNIGSPKVDYYFWKNDTAVKHVLESDLLKVFGDFKH